MVYESYLKKKKCLKILSLCILKYVMLTSKL